jgi:hypothetical protein
VALIGRLPEGPLDIVGDVHGETQALDLLLARLGYRADGRHAEGRRLVFIGDLCDRGPDSPGVFERVRRIVGEGRGLCLLGNHELNLLRHAHKQGNGWFFPEPEDHDLASGHFAGCRRLERGERGGLLEFMRGLPLVLERDDLRLVHACWDPASIEALRGDRSGDLLRLYRDSELRFHQQLEGSEFEALADAEARVFEPLATDRAQVPPAAPNHARRDALYQNGNPVRAIASGPEQITGRPFFSSGKWRLLERLRWWEHYADAVPVVFGHYWRVPLGMEQPAHKGIEDIFSGYAEGAWLGPQQRAFCVDYCVGARFIERLQGATDRFQSRLAALRWPECVLLMDDGRVVQAAPAAG